MWIFTHSITFLYGRFMYIHTFFHCKIMCSCRLATCLYDIQQTSYERRLHHSRVAPFEPIWAEFAFTIDKIYPQLIRAVTPVLFVCTAPPRLYIGIYYWGENLHSLIRTYAHEKIQVDFFRAKPLYVLYIAGKNVKIVRCARAYVRSTPRFFTSFE